MSAGRARRLAGSAGTVEPNDPTRKVDVEATDGMIDVMPKDEGDPMIFDVTVRDESGTSRHTVTMAKATYRKLSGGKVTPSRCVQAAFEYLLERESKESILTNFDITMLSAYFPTFGSEFKYYL